MRQCFQQRLFTGKFTDDSGTDAELDILLVNFMQFMQHFYSIYATPFRAMKSWKTINMSILNT